MYMEKCQDKNNSNGLKLGCALEFVGLLEQGAGGISIASQKL